MGSRGKLCEALRGVGEYTKQRVFYRAMGWRVSLLTGRALVDILRFWSVQIGLKRGRRVVRGVRYAQFLS